MKRDDFCHCNTRSSKYGRWEKLAAGNWRNHGNKRKLMDQSTPKTTEPQSLEKLFAVSPFMDGGYGIKSDTRVKLNCIRTVRIALKRIDWLILAKTSRWN